MKKKFILLLSFAGFLTLHSQTIEEKIAAKTCECLQKSSNITNDIFRDCLTKSMTEQIFTDKDPKVRESINTVDGIQTTILRVKEIVSKECPKLVPAVIENKEDIYYGKSKNKSAQNFYIIGQDFMDQKNFKLAVESFQLALKEDPNFVLALDDIAVSYRQLDDYENAIKYYKKSLDIYPEGHFALMNIGVVYTFKSDYKTAISYYQKLIDYHPDSAEGYFGAGKNYFLLKDDEKALDNMFMAHRIYTESKSDYVKDSEQIIGAIYQKMKSENKEDVFKKIAEKNNVQIN
ncbi:tetratricopeptide (TPR) repeat protein [Flavobacterium nitrogenifigens]|uniref:Tetratricopeptide (TPR) repeat protein n=2 Tax=Flavobacterium TaxID=237 RepID=A0A7W7IUU2_9FLAO|nr:MULTISPECIES: tetratricopeptide repeat protein [Flavobacterium]MBB4800976.1 tetratricopeptide (TPR) repeat protein [Flavobacterium nitrogenifigens]MBB6385276.1 tetratricopeptide (TPR) repeat protein [Flavobacterium notoginsengisoli]